MITENQLFNLGYFKKPDNINMRDGSTDFKHKDFKNRTYLVNLNAGGITIMFPMSKPQKGFSCNDYNTFLNWHESYIGHFCPSPDMVQS